MSRVILCKKKKSFKKLQKKKKCWIAVVWQSFWTNPENHQQFFIIISLDIFMTLDDLLYFSSLPIFLIREIFNILLVLQSFSLIGCVIIGFLFIKLFPYFLHLPHNPLLRVFISSLFITATSLTRFSSFCRLSPFWERI